MYIYRVTGREASRLNSLLFHSIEGGVSLKIYRIVKSQAVLRERGEEGEKKRGEGGEGDCKTDIKL